ncbi:hypothetical protein JCM9279_001802 [Rhodotorula babjevae]
MLRRTAAAFLPTSTRRAPATTRLALLVRPAPSAAPALHHPVMSTTREASSSSAATAPPPPLTPWRTHTPAPDASPSTPLVYTFYHDPTATWTYLVVDPHSRHCAIIDSVLDYDPASRTVSTSTADALVAFIEHEGLTVDRILETHAHADHLTAAAYLQLRLSSPSSSPSTSSSTVPIGAHRGMRSTQAHFAKLYDVPAADLEHAFDELYDEGDHVRVGALDGVVWHLPGHTQCSAGYVFGDSVFTGDSVLLPPTGTARADFPLGSASALFSSTQRLLALPSHVRLFSGHSYPLAGSSNLCSATVAQQRALNPHVHDGVDEEGFVKMRSERDQGLSEPKLLHQSLQVNIRAGRLPRGSTGQPFFRTPLHAPTVL